MEGVAGVGYPTLCMLPPMMFVWVALADGWFRIPHKPPAGSLKVLHAPARRGGIRRASQTKIYNLETDEFVSNPPFSKNEFGGSNISTQFLAEEQLE